jgi:hypothetical protein
MIFVCKHCGKEFKKKPSSKAKYCSLECMRKDPDYRKSLSDAAKRIGYKGTEKQKESQRKMVEASRQARIKKYGKYEDRLVKCKNGQILDITNGELEKYRKTHFVCEICGKPEKMSHNGKNISQLCCDHDHKTSKFRGLLCCDCNRKLGWFENLEEEVLKYLKRK